MVQAMSKLNQMTNLLQKSEKENKYIIRTLSIAFFFIKVIRLFFGGQAGSTE